MIRKQLTTLGAGAALAALLSVALVNPWPALAHGDHASHGKHASQSFAAGEPGDVKRPFRTVEVIMKDEDGKMSYTPDRIDVKRGEQVKFVLKNAGIVDHEFLIDTVKNNARHKEEMAKNPDMQHDEPNGARLKPGETREILWRFSKTGTFEFACLLPGHYESGMKGVVAIK
jgi:uncharacterized cupredoxin-like copper-binding protein